MVSQQYVQDQMKRLGLKFRFIGRAEVNQLAHILLPGEQIQHCVNGLFSGAGALLCATDRRLLLIDKRPWFLNVEDIGYDMITEVDLSVRMFDSFIHIHTASKQLTFRSWQQGNLHKLCHFIQERIVFLKHAMFEASQQAQAAHEMLHNGMYSPQAAQFMQMSQPQIPQSTEAAKPAQPAERHFFYGYPNQAMPALKSEPTPEI